jgi:hypothetical protein
MAMESFRFEGFGLLLLAPFLAVAMLAPKFIEMMLSGGGGGGGGHKKKSGGGGHH